MSPLSRRSLLAGAAVLPFLGARAQAQGYGQASQGYGQMAPAQPVQAATNQVVIQGMAFNPASLTVAAGTTVVFANQDGVAHTVTGDNGSFDSGNIPSGSAVQITFSSPGSYPYHCSIHPSMRAAVTVA